MKTKMLILAILIAATNGFSNNPVYPDYVPESYVLKLEAEFVKKMDNQNLINHIEKNFVALFDNVNAIHTQYSDEFGFYYLVFGVKSNISKIELLKIEEEDYLNETYTYIDFSKINVNSSTVYCGINYLPPIDPCAYTICRQITTTQCLVMSCGIWNGEECVQQ